MTREQAINYLYSSGFSEEQANTIVKAFEPTTKNNLAVDCIDRRETINRIFYSTDNSGDVVLGSALRERIEKLPPVTPIRPKGHWTDDGYCSCCNQQTLPLDESGYMSYYHSFCPNCGADMREVEE